VRIVKKPGTPGFFIGTAVSGTERNRASLSYARIEFTRALPPCGLRCFDGADLQTAFSLWKERGEQPTHRGENAQKTLA
jgi:hypothetical protein